MTSFEMQWCYKNIFCAVMEGVLSFFSFFSVGSVGLFWNW